MEKSKPIRKVVIPAAGWGTRFLPQTKATPKEMLPVIDKPVIQYVVEEAAASGIEDVIIITGWQKRAIEDHFDRSLELERFLESRGKIKELKQIREIAKLAHFVYIRQNGEQYGNAIPVLASHAAVGQEPFAVVWGDEFIAANPPRISQMIKVYQKYGGAVLSVLPISDPKQLSRYGVIDAKPVKDNVYQIKKIAPLLIWLLWALTFCRRKFSALSKIWRPEMTKSGWLTPSMF